MGVVLSRVISAYSQNSPDPASREKAVEIYVNHLRQDPSFEGRIPINFYGKAVDENNQPIAGATAHLQWNTPTAIGGTAFSQVVSDEQGRFSLTGEHGKILGVRVEKDGYYTMDGGLGALHFEYANPASPNFYTPDPSKPVVFHLRKKGEGVPLVSRSLVTVLHQSHPSSIVNLETGFIKPDGTLTITANKPNPHEVRGRVPWSVTLTMAEGGLIETTDPHPVLAPAGGYASALTIDMTDTSKPTHSNGATRIYYFYLPSTNTYGSLTIDTLVSDLRIFLTYVHNTTAGDRRLEPKAK